LIGLKTWSLAETDGQNKYLVDRETKRTHLCHPLLFYIINAIDDGVDIPKWLNSITDDNDSIDIENLGRFSKNEIHYYYRKYLILKENGYFTPIDQAEKLGGQLTPDSVKKTLANLKQVTFECTSRCSLNCSYCGYGKFYDDYDKRQNENLNPGTAFRLLSYLLDLWNSPLNDSHNSNIYIGFYGGEPLLNFPFITQVVDYVRNLNALHRRFTFTMTTNAILLHKYMDYLAENDFSLLISLDGNRENNAYRVYKNGKSSFDTVFKNIAALRDKYPEYFLNRVNFNAVLHNKNSVPDIYRFFKTHFDKVPSIGSLNTGGIKKSQIEEFRKTYSNFNESLYQSEDYSMIEKDMFVKLPNIQDVMIYLHKYQDYCFNDYNDLIYDTHGKFIPTGTCAPFSKKIFVTVKG